MRLWPSCCPGEASEAASSWWVIKGHCRKLNGTAGSARSKGHPAQILAGRTFEECPALLSRNFLLAIARCVSHTTPHNSRTKPCGLIASFRINQPQTSTCFRKHHTASSCALAMQTSHYQRFTTRRARDLWSVMRHKVASIEDRRKREEPFGTKTANDRTTRLRTQTRVERG